MQQLIFECLLPGIYDFFLAEAVDICALESPYLPQKQEAVVYILFEAEIGK